MRSRPSSDEMLSVVFDERGRRRHAVRDRITVEARCAKERHLLALVVGTPAGQWVAWRYMRGKYQQRNDPRGGEGVFRVHHGWQGVWFETRDFVFAGCDCSVSHKEIGSGPGRRSKSVALWLDWFVAQRGTVIVPTGARVLPPRDGSAAIDWRQPY